MIRLIVLRVMVPFTVLLLHTSLLAQTDSLVLARELVFHSDFERQLFQRQVFGKEKLDPLAFLLAADPSSNEESLESARARFRWMDEVLKKAGVDTRKPEKKIKEIYTLVHRAFLKQYQLENRMPDVFRNGDYNCVTASALYALVLQDRMIPYTIKEKPTHVFLVAYPNSNNILIETTSPLFGYLSFDNTYKSTFVNNLKGQKLISASEMENKTVDELFNKYYFRDEDIDIRKLIGIHYMNDALFKQDHNDDMKAFQQAEKAWLFYPSERAAYILRMLAGNIMAANKLAPTQRAIMLGKASRYQAQGITPAMIEGEFAGLTQTLLIEQDKKAVYKICFDTLQAIVRDTALQHRLAFLYNYENGRILYNQGNYMASRKYVANAMSIQPNNADLITMMTIVLGQSMRNSRDYNAIADTLSSYLKRFPSLARNDNFNNMFLSTTLTKCYDAFEKGKEKLGLDTMAEFEKEMHNNPALSPPTDLVASTYGKAVSYYFKKGQLNRAKEILNKGLEWAPDNQELKMRLIMMKK
ncbi:MAG: hypothetical protein K1X47_15555 [Cyclobacteriaceae bacterium]|nr:hypothetical protein [Cyclobacteriaceae bacterium]